MDESEVLKEIKKHFSFLFDRGYEIVSTHYYPGRYSGGLEVVFESPDFSLKIGDDDGLSFSFRSLSGGYMSVGALIYFLSSEKEILGASSGMKKCASMIGKYIDEIESRFRDDYSGLEKDVESIQKKYEDAVAKSFIWPVSSIIYGLFFIVCFNIYNELVLGWLLSEWLLNLGYEMPSLLINSVSLVLAAGTTYAIHKAATRPIDETELIVVPTDQSSKKKSAVVTVIHFLIFWVAYVLIMFVLSSYLPIINTSLETIIITSEVLIGFLLAVWTVRKTGTR